MTRWSCRRCSAGPPRSWPPRSVRVTNVRSSIATTSCCCEGPVHHEELGMTVLEQAAQARSASIDLAAATRAEKDAALLLMADRLVERTDDIAAANAVDVENARTGGMSASMVALLLLPAERIAGMAEGLRQLAALPDPVGDVVR